MTGVFNEAPTLSPTVGSAKGGTKLTIDGHGFTMSTDEAAVATLVTVGDNDCTVISSTHSQVICDTTSSDTTGTALPVVVNIGSASHSVGSFTYDAAITPTVTSMDPDTGGVGEVVTIAGTLFSETPAENTVTLSSSNGDVACTVTARCEIIAKYHTKYIRAVVKYHICVAT